MMFPGPGTAILEWVRFSVDQPLTPYIVTLLRIATVQIIVNGREQLACPFAHLQHEEETFTLNPTNAIELKAGDTFCATLSFPEGVILAEPLIIDAELKITATGKPEDLEDIQRRIRRHTFN